MPARNGAPKEAFGQLRALNKLIRLSPEPSLLEVELEAEKFPFSFSNNLLLFEPKLANISFRFAQNNEREFVLIVASYRQFQ